MEFVLVFPSAKRLQELAGPEPITQELLEAFLELIGGKFPGLFDHVGVTTKHRSTGCAADGAVVCEIGHSDEFFRAALSAAKFYRKPNAVVVQKDVPFTVEVDPIALNAHIDDWAQLLPQPTS